MKISQVLEISNTINSMCSIEFRAPYWTYVKHYSPFCFCFSLSVSPVPATAVSGGADASPKSA